MSHDFPPNRSGNKAKLYSRIRPPASHIAGLFILLAGVLAPAIGFAGTYTCPVETKRDAERTYSKGHIEKYRFSIKIEEAGDEAFVSRCSLETGKTAVTCDRYKVDRVEIDPTVGVKKYYVFAGQFDLQLFPNLSFVENNGRASVAWGKCRPSLPAN